MTETSVNELSNRQNRQERRPAVPRVILAVDSLEPGNGGICRVARLMARVLEAREKREEIRARAIILKDATPPPDLTLRCVACNGSRLKFVSRVQAASFWADRFCYDFVGMARAHCRLPGLRRPMLTWIHGIEVWEGHDLRPDRALWARRADALLSNTFYTRSRAAEANPEMARASVCWLATEEEHPPQLVESARDGVASTPTALLLGRLEGRYKGHDEMIDVWPEVVERIPNARLLIAGKGPDRERLERKAVASRARTMIEFRGFVPEAEMPRLWAETRILAMPSRGEGFGLVYAEAMRHGIPCIASLQDAAQEITLNGQTGLNVDLDADDARERLVEAVSLLLSDDTIATSMGAAGFQRWMSEFNYSGFARRFEPLFDEFLDRGRLRVA